MKVQFRESRGFTLVELLAVVLIILIVAGLTVSIAKRVGERANISHTQALVAKLELGIEAFKLDNGYYPTSSVYRSSFPFFHAEKDNSRLLYSQLLSSKKYVSLSPSEIVTADGAPYIVDAWGTPIVYHRPVNFVPYGVSNCSTNYGQNWVPVPVANYYVHAFDNFSTGGVVNVQSYDLFSYGPDATTFVSGASANPSKVAAYWPIAWSDARSKLDDIGNFRK